MKKVVNKREEKKEFKGFKNRTIAILYIICSIAWLISGILNLKNSGSSLGYIDLVLAILWMVLGILYFIKDKKEK